MLALGEDEVRGRATTMTTTTSARPLSNFVLFALLLAGKVGAGMLLNHRSGDTTRHVRDGGGRATATSTRPTTYRS